MIKKKLRKAVTEEKADIIKTGGGEKKMISKDPNMDLC